MSQLKKALQQLHVNQRILYADIKILDGQPEVSIDGVTYENASLGPIESISISRAMQYQNDEAHNVQSMQMLKEVLKKDYPNFENTLKDKELNYAETLQFMQNILMSTHQSDLQL